MAIDLKEMVKTPDSIINRLHVLIGMVALSLGSMVYIVDRPPEQTYFVWISNISLHKFLPNIFGPIGNSLPAFIHVFSFIMITAGLISCQKRGYLIISLCWFLIDSAFEMGQKFNTWPSRMTLDWFSGIPFLENTENYFLRGTFDYIDLVAIAFGTAIAYFILSTTNKRKRRVML